MRIVDRKTFLAMPEGTVFAEVNRIGDCLTGVMIKDVTLEGNYDYCESMLGDFDGVGRNAMYEETQEYGIYTPEEIVSMIETLTAAYDGQVLEQYNRNRAKK